MSEVPLYTHTVSDLTPYTHTTLHPHLQGPSTAPAPSTLSEPFNRLTPYRGTSLIRNPPPPWDHRRVLGIVLLLGPRGARFLMSEVPRQSSLLHSSQK